jgi:hypothetical protein
LACVSLSRTKVGVKVGVVRVEFQRLEERLLTIAIATGACLAEGVGVCVIEVGCVRTVVDRLLNHLVNVVDTIWQCTQMRYTTSTSYFNDHTNSLCSIQY